MQTFDADIRAFVLGNLPTTPDSIAVLRGKGPIELLAIYANWRRRLVDPMPRQVHLSAEFRANPLLKSQEYRNEIPLLIRNIATGADVRPHLSARVNVAFEVRDPAKPKKVTARRDVDMLLNEWGVHHLHLSSQPGRNGFTKRTEVVLLGAFTNTDAYIIDLVPHGEWSNDRIVQIMVREWPDAGLIHKIQGVLPDRQSPTKEQRKNLRNNGTNAAVSIGDSVYMGFGFSSSGISSAAMFEAMQVHRRLEWFAKSLEADPLMVARTLLSAGALPPAEPDLHFEVMKVGGWGVVERKTRTMMSLS